MFKKIIIIFISSLLAIVFFEFFLKYSPYEYGIVPVEYHKKIGIWHKKEFESYKISECYKTKYMFDEQGVTKNIYDYDSTKKDVIILGDSLVEAIMVKNEDIINNSLAKEFIGNYNFLNYALSSSGPTQEYITLIEEAKLDNAKYVIQFIDLEGDIQDVDSRDLNSLGRPKVRMRFDSLNKLTVIPPREPTLYDIFGDLIGDYQIYFFIRSSIYHFRDNILSKPTKGVLTRKEQRILDRNITLEKVLSIEEQKVLNQNWLNLKGAIFQTNKYIKSNSSDIKYKLIVTSENQKNKMILKRFLDEQNIEFLFLIEAANSMNLQIKYFECDNHWTDETHINIAKIVKKTRFIN